MTSFVCGVARAGEPYPRNKTQFWPMFRSCHKAESPHESNEYFNMHEHISIVVVVLRLKWNKTNVDCVENIGFCLAIGGSFCSRPPPMPISLPVCRYRALKSKTIEPRRVRPRIYNVVIINYDIPRLECSALCYFHQILFLFLSFL